ncbi:MAG: type II toxin-antitoxin system VapC family toxin [Syntrophobacteraceae bacterium]
MRTILLDTNVVSFILKGDSRMDLYTPHLRGCKLALSFMTVAELFQWAEVRRWGPRRTARLRKALERFIVFPADIESCSHWGMIRAKYQANGRPISPQDAWIAATARRFKLPLATHNPVDFEFVEDLEIITA